MFMKDSVKSGMSFGLSSGVITTLGLLVGLWASTDNKMVVIGGVFMIAIADSFSDALGIHLSKESVKKHNKKYIWDATLSTFFTKFFIASSFLAFLFFFSLNVAIVISVVYGFVLIGVFSWWLAKERGEKIWRGMLEHLFIAFVVVAITYFVGHFVNRFF